MTTRSEVIKGATSDTYTPTKKDDDGQIPEGDSERTRTGEGEDHVHGKTTAAIVVQVRTDNPPKFDKDETGNRSIREDLMLVATNGNGTW